MNKVQHLTGIPGMLRPYKEHLDSLSLTPEAQVVFFGLPGTCLPFVEILCYAVRNIPHKPVFVPVLDVLHPREIIHHEGLGFQTGEVVKIQNPAVIVIMGGLSMMGSGVSALDVKQVIASYSGASVLGICFMNMFEKTGWTQELQFDLLIDAEVTVDIYTQS